jgi:hypothetical protein
MRLEEMHYRAAAAGAGIWKTEAYLILLRHAAGRKSAFW